MALRDLALVQELAERGGPPQCAAMAQLRLSCAGWTSTEPAYPIVCQEIAGLLVVESVAEPSVADVLQRHVRASGLKCVGIQVTQSGREVLRADGDSRSIGPGELLIWCSDRPLELVATESHRKISLIVPWSELKRRLLRVSTFRHAILDGELGMGALLRSHIEALAGQAERLQGADESAIRRATIELVTAVMMSRVDPASRTRLSDQYLLRIQNYIVDHLQQEQLSPAHIAKVHNISERYLHRLFSESGASVSDFIREQRLNRCWEALTNPANVSICVAEIAHKWGFPAPAHFSRIFKQRFGVSPTDARPCN